MPTHFSLVRLEDRLTPAFPLAVNDTYPIEPDTPRTFNVLENDAFTSQVLISSFTTPPDEQGVIQQNADGTFTFTPSGAFTDSSFTYTLAPRQRETPLVPASSDIRVGSDYGSFVALSEDGNLAVVAAPGGRGGTSGSTNGAGAVFVFARGGDGWTLRQKLFANGDTNANADSEFGSSIALSADGSTLAVGDIAANGGGAVYVFSRSGSTFGATPTRIGRPADAGVQFGLSVAISGDGSRLAVGDTNSAGGNSGNVAEAGSVYLYARDGSTFGTTPSQRLFAAGDSTATGNSEFGRSLAFDRDGTTLAVGDPSATGGASGSVSIGGAVYVFRRDGGTFGTPVKLTQAGDSSATAAQLFGFAVALSLDGATLAVGAPDALGGNNGSVAGAGAVYTFREAGGVFGTTGRKLTPRADNGFGRGFGGTVALGADGTSLAVGDSSAAGGTNGNIDSAGAIYLYRRPAGSDFPAAATIKVISAGGASGDGFGATVAMAGDGNTILGGAPVAGGALIEEVGSSTATVTLDGPGVTNPVNGDADRILAVSGPGGVVRRLTFGADAQGTLGDPFTPFAGYTGAVQSAFGDVNDDGFVDAIYGIGPAGGSLLRVVSGADGSDLVPAFATFEAGFTGGIFVAVGDIDGDGGAEIAVSPDVGGGGRIQIFTFIDGTFTQRDNFFGIEDQSFRGGARVALGDIDGDGRRDLAVGAGFGGGPRVAVFAGDGLLNFAESPPKMVADFFAFPGPDTQNLRNGVYLALGDLDGDGRADMIFGGGPGGGPRVLVLGGTAVQGDVGSSSVAPLLNFFVNGDTTSRGGVHVAAKRIDAGATFDLVIGSGNRTPSDVRTYMSTTPFPASGSEPAVTQDIDPFGATVETGVFVG